MFHVSVEKLLSAGWTLERGNLQPPQTPSDIGAPHPFDLGPQWELANLWHGVFHFDSDHEKVEAFVENEWCLPDQASECDPGPALPSGSPWRWRIVGLPDGVRCGRAETPVAAAATVEDIIATAGGRPFRQTMTRRDVSD